MSDHKKSDNVSEKDGAKANTAKKAPKPASGRQRPAADAEPQQKPERSGGPRQQKSTGQPLTRRVFETNEKFWICTSHEETKRRREYAEGQTRERRGDGVKLDTDGDIVKLRVKDNFKTRLVALADFLAKFYNGEVTFPVTTEGQKCTFHFCCFKLWSPEHRPAYAHDMAAWITCTTLGMLLSCDAPVDENGEDHKVHNGNMLAGPASTAEKQEVASVGSSDHLGYRLIATPKKITDEFAAHVEKQFIRDQIIPFFAGRGWLSRFGAYGKTASLKSRTCKTPVCHALLASKMANPKDACKHIHHPDQVIASCIFRILLDFKEVPLERKGPQVMSRNLSVAVLPAAKKDDKKNAPPPLTVAKDTGASVSNPYDSLRVEDAADDSDEPDTESHPESAAAAAPSGK